MRKLKHNKIKNTGLLFELLSRAMVYDALNPKQQQNAAKIIRKHFTPKSELLKELKLYNSLSNRTEYDANELLNLNLESHRSLRKDALLREKFDLIKSIKKYYVIEDFFNARVSNYKLNASIYKLFEYKGSDNPDEYLSTKKLVIEALSGQVIEENVIDEVEQVWREQDKDVRRIGFKLLVEKFNDKYRDLNENQKKLLAQYCNNDANAAEFKDYVIREAGMIGSTLNSKLSDISDNVTKIKVTESINLLQNIVVAKQINEDHLTALLKYYELMEVL